MATRNCKHCGREFVTDINSQKYCSVKCRKLHNRKSQKVTPRAIPYICAYCGTEFGGRKKKYCCEEHRLIAHGKSKPKPRKNSPKNFMSIEEVARASREMGMTAGEYMAKFCYGKEG